MAYWAKCETCKGKYRGVEGTKECRECRGWHTCLLCQKALANKFFRTTVDRGNPRRGSYCRSCERATSKTRNRTNRTIGRTHKANHKNVATVLAAYRISEEERPLLERVVEAVKDWRAFSGRRGPKPYTRTPVDIMEDLDFHTEMRLSQAALEIVRLEAA